MAIFNYSAVFGAAGFAGDSFDIAAGSANTDIIDVLLSVGSGSLTADAPLVLISSGALGGDRNLDISALEAETAQQGGQALPGRFFYLSVQNSDISTNNISVNSSATINGIAAVSASLLAQGLTFSSILPGVIGNSYSVTVIDTSAGGLSYTEVGGAIIIDLGGATPTTSQVVTEMMTTNPSAYVSVVETTPGSVIVASILPLAGGISSLSIASTGDYLFFHVASGAWRANQLPRPSEPIATIARINFLSSDWDAGATKNQIKVIASGSPAAGEVGPHGLQPYASYVVEVINTSFTPDEKVDVEVQFGSNGDITLVKAGKAADFNGTVVIVGSLD